MSVCHSVVKDETDILGQCNIANLALLLYFPTF